MRGLQYLERTLEGDPLLRSKGHPVYKVFNFLYCASKGWRLIVRTHIYGVHFSFHSAVLCGVDCITALDPGLDSDADPSSRRVSEAKFPDGEIEVCFLRFLTARSAASSARRPLSSLLTK